MTLDEVPQRTAVRVSTLTMTAADQQRLTELGLRHGARVEVLRRAPFGGPLALRVADGGLLALRRAQAARIVVAEEDARV
jgi:Fe2+ transport system protein FeoA